MFQWAPTLGGECYITFRGTWILTAVHSFNGHPPLGVNATRSGCGFRARSTVRARFNGHPPLGVNATLAARYGWAAIRLEFQWAPTLGGECYLMEKAAPDFRPILAFQWAPTLGGECYA